MMRSETWARHCGVLTLALLLLPARLLATCDLGCGSDDPCIVSSPVAVDNGCKIDIGTRELRVANGGVLDVGSGTMTLDMGTLTVQTGGFIRARGDMTATGGTIFVVAGSVTVSPDAPASPTSPIDASGATGGAIYISAAGNIAVTGSITAKALNTENLGGTVQLTAATATVSAPISGLGGTDSTGGSVEVDTDGDLTINNTLDASGGGSGGGFVEVSTTTGNLKVDNSGVLRADSITGGGDGGDVELTASGDGVTTGMATINGKLSAMGSNGTDSGGDGGSICIEATDGDIHMDLASAAVIADGGAPDGTAGDVGVIVDAGAMTMQGTLTAKGAGVDSSGGDVSIDSYMDTTIGGSIVVTAGSSGGGTVELCSDFGSVSIAATGVVNASGSALAAGDGGSICLASGTDLSAPQAVLVEGKLIADGGPGGGAGGAIDLEGADSVRIASSGSLHASGGNGGGGTGGAGGTLKANAAPGITSIEGPMTAAGGNPGGAGGVLSINAVGLVSVIAPLDGSGSGNGGMVGIGSATTLGPIDVYGNITVASSAAIGGTIELMDEGDIIVGSTVGGTLVSTGVVAPTNSSQVGIDVLGCNVTLCGLNVQSCPSGSTGVLTSLGPSGVNRVTDRNSTLIAGTMSANKNSGSNDLVYDGADLHKPAVPVPGQVQPAAMFTVNPALMPCPICGDGIKESPETCDPPDPSHGCSSTCQLEPPLPGDANGDRVVSVDDIGFLIEEIFDGDGDSVSMVSEGSFPGAPGADANGDTLITAADITATIKILFPAP